MLTTEFSETKKAWINLRQQANYWKTQHAKSIGREKVLKAKVQEQEETLRSQNVQLKKISEQIEELKAQNAWLKQQIFGRKTEQRKDEANDPNEKNPSLSDASSENENEKKRQRGQQEGAPGHGRKRRTNLSSVKVCHDLKEHEKICPICGLPFDQKTFE